MTQYIMRPVYNRPEMLQLSIDYEIKARENCNFDFKTIFIVEYNSPQATLDVIKKYPFQYECLCREQRYGLSANILEGFKYTFEKAADWVLYIEDDILLHETYFEYVNAVFDCIEDIDWSIISSFNFNDAGSVSEIRLDRHYAAQAPIINKYFFETYIKPCAKSDFYKHPAAFVCALNDLYKDYWVSRVYRYKTDMHHQQAGLINRLCDVARIEEGMSVIMPSVNRQMHIGFFGFNRPGGVLQGSTFDERLAYLKQVIKTPESMYAATGSKQYDDYAVFSDKLNQWDGKLTWAEKNYTS